MEIIENDLKEKYFKIKECLSRCGNDVIEINKKDGKTIKGEVSCYHKTYDRIDLKNGGLFTKSDQGFSIIDYSPTGKAQKRLTFMIK